MPAKGLSLHLGINRVDPAHYHGWDGALLACEFDAKDMQALADSRGFKSTLLLTSAVTSAAVTAAIADAATRLKRGDCFFLTYSGHGGQVPDTNFDETGPADRQDETWALYDRELIDDELYALWAKFKAGVRIIVLSDSCHSGTVTRALPRLASSAARTRAMPPTVANRTYQAHRRLYEALQKRTPAGEKRRVAASVLLISGCQDNQTSLDGDRNGLFTQHLRAVWNSGRFRGSLRDLRDQIAARMPSSQTPNYFRTGAASATFEAQLAFKL
jgi:hypothetical protein